MFTYSHANAPLSQSERMHYLSFFVKFFIQAIAIKGSKSLSELMPGKEQLNPSLLHLIS